MSKAKPIRYQLGASDSASIFHFVFGRDIPLPEGSGCPFERGVFCFEGGEGFQEIETRVYSKYTLTLNTPLLTALLCREETPLSVALLWSDPLGVQRRRASTLPWAKATGFAR